MATPAIPRVGLLINRNFALLFLGQLVSLIGDQIFDVTLTLWVGAVIARGQSWAPLAVSGTLIAAVTPTFLVGPLAGVFADRWNHRCTILRMDVARAALITLLIFLASFAPLAFVASGYLPVGVKLGVIYAIVFLANSCAQFFNPSRLALIGAIVPEPQRPRAAGLFQTTFALSTVIGPPMAAPLLYGLGIQWALFANALSFIISFGAIAAIRHVPADPVVTTRDSVRGEFVQGVRYAFGNTTIRVLIIAAAISALGFSALEALFLFFVTDNLHVAAGQFGYFPAALGLGAVVGAAGMSIVANKLSMTWVVRFSLLLSGVCFLFFARQSTLIPTLLLVCCLGLLQSALNVAVTPLILRVTPPSLIGRVAAVFNPTVQARSSSASCWRDIWPARCCQDFMLPC